MPHSGKMWPIVFWGRLALHLIKRQAALSYLLQRLLNAFHRSSSTPKRSNGVVVVVAVVSVVFLYVTDTMKYKRNSTHRKLAGLAYTKINIPMHIHGPKIANVGVYRFML